MLSEKLVPAIASAGLLLASVTLAASPAAAAPPVYPLTGIEGSDVSIAPDGSFAFVSSHAQKVVKVDTATNTVISERGFMSGRWVEAVAVSPDGTYVYAAEYVTPSMNGTVHRIDASTNTFVGAGTAVGKNPSDVVFAPDGSFALVVNSEDGTVSRLDTATDTVTATFLIGTYFYPSQVAIAPDGSFAYVSNTNNDSLARLDLVSDTVVGYTPVGDFPMGVAFSADGSTVYAANSGSGTISEIDTATDAVVGTITMPGRDVRALALNPADGRLLTAEYTTDDLYTVDPATAEVFSVGLGVGSYGPNAIATDGSGSFAYVLNRMGYVSRLDAPTAPAITSAVGGDKSATVTFDAADGKGFDVTYQYSLDGGTTWTSPDPAVTSSPMTIAGLQRGTTYEVKLRAATAYAFGPASAAASVTTQPAPDPTPTPTPPPTPTPTPSPTVKKVQKPADAMGQPPSAIRMRGITVITGRNAQTNAGQMIRTQVRASMPGAVAQGERRYLRVIRGPKGLVKVRTYGQPDLKVVVRQYAPSTASYKAFNSRTVYVGGVRR